MSSRSTHPRQWSGRLRRPPHPDLAAAAALLRAGELVAFPTDTVYGVGAVCWNDGGGRPALHRQAAQPGQGDPDPAGRPRGPCARRARPRRRCGTKLAEAFWPGPLTLVVPKVRRVPAEVTAGGDTVAVRIPDHDLARALIRLAGAPLATTSANLSGGPSPVTAAGSRGAARRPGRPDPRRRPLSRAAWRPPWSTSRDPPRASCAPGPSPKPTSWLCYNRVDWRTARAISPVMLIGIDASRAATVAPHGHRDVLAARDRRACCAWRRRAPLSAVHERSAAARAFRRRRAGESCCDIPFRRLWTHVRLSAEMAGRPPDVLFVPAHVLPLIHPAGQRRHRPRSGLPALS